MANELTTRNSIADLFKANIKAIKSVLPDHIKPEKILRLAYQATEVNPRLAGCTKASLINAVMESSILGLEPNSPSEHAHLIPYGNKAQLVIGYKGYQALAYRSGHISRFSIHSVHSKDHFKYQYGTSPFIEHIPNNDDDNTELIYAYAIAYFKDGTMEFEVVDKRLAMKAKNKSAAKNKKDSPWNTEDEDAMWEKTAMRRLAKRLPMSADLQRAATLDDMAESGIKQNISYIPDTDNGLITSDDLTKKIQNASEPQKSHKKNSEGIDKHKSESSKPATNGTARTELIKGIRKHFSNDEIDSGIYKLGWSETTEIDNLSFDMLNQLLEKLHEEVKK